ncbi:MAG: hypothetical protein EBU89_01445 [Actinobacteria bacterium]|nr:hypothetical protein [Actinomycetota bacterium]
MRLKLIGGILIGVLALSGCTGIPTSSKVHYGDEISEDTSTQFVRVIARPPSLGMSPAEIVRGFLDACADPSENYGIARQYLAIESAGDWNPLTGIEIYEASTVEVAESAASVTVAAEKLGAISDLGRFQIADPGTQVSKSFELQEDAAGQWRISKASDGILLSSGDVDRSFRSFPIYFFNTDLTSLVTDNLLVPVSNSGAATSLVRALLDGPSPYLSPVATSAFPVGTTLTYGSVPVTNGIAQVDFSNEILGADELTRRALSAQLVWTLSKLANVSAVQISVSGQPFVLSKIGPLQTVKDWQNFSPVPNASEITLNVIRNEKIVSFSNDVENLRYVAPTPLAFAVPNINNSQIATVSADRKSVLVTDSAKSNFRVVAQGDQISKPTWDRDGRIYFSDFGQGVREVLSDSSLRIVPVDASALGTSDQVKQVSISSDGVRVAVVLSNGIQDVIAVGAIFRTDAETRIIGLHRIERSITSVREIVWSSPTSIAALGTDESNSDLLFDISLLDGKSKMFSAPIGAQQLSVDGTGRLHVSAVDGADQLVYQQNFGSWTQVTSGIGGFFTN